MKTKNFISALLEETTFLQDFHSESGNKQEKDSVVMKKYSEITILPHLSPCVISNVNFEEPKPYGRHDANHPCRNAFDCR